MTDKTKRKIIKEKIEHLESDIAYNDAPGVHTFFPCSNCGKGTRTGQCSNCLREQIEGLKLEIKK